jgi:hypothetical protein
MYRNQQGGYNKIMMQMQNLTYTLDNSSMKAALETLWRNAAFRGKSSLLPQKSGSAMQGMKMQRSRLRNR